MVKATVSDRASDYVNQHLGGNAYWQRLKEAGWSRDEIKEQLEGFMEFEHPVIELMGGRETYEMLPKEWQGPMFVLTALRHMIEQAGVELLSDEEIRRRKWEDEERERRKSAQRSPSGAFGNVIEMPTGPVTYTD